MLSTRYFVQRTRNLLRQPMHRQKCQPAGQQFSGRDLDAAGQGFQADARMADLRASGSIGQRQRQVDDDVCSAAGDAIEGGLSAEKSDAFLDAFEA